MALLVHRSNRVERLAEQLAKVVRAPLADPFARECIVVQGPGMERWLSAFLARRLGVWANPWFPFPRALIELFMDQVLGPCAAPSLARARETAAAETERPRELGAQLEALTFRIARELPTQLSDPAFREVAAYLRDDRDCARLIDFASRLAERFDQYLIYRPELLSAWERGEEQHFQAKLFRSLAPAIALPHRRLLALSRALEAGQRLSSDGLPERVSLFGLSTLPPVFLALLARIAQQLDVHVFVLTPSREYWGDLDRRERARSDLHGWLAQLGKVSREFIDLLEGVSYLEPEPALFEAPGHDTMLRALQSDLVELLARARDGQGAFAPLGVRPHDDSLRVHVCHSMVRELEVLRDQLRARFERDPTLEPRDVIVFAPDIERYAPAIEAVFTERGARDPTRIPFRIADRRALRASQLTEAFFALLELLGSRLALSEVLDLLRRECVRRRFEIAETELDRIQHWLVDAGGRWALDAAHRESFAQPRFAENSLRFALERLLAGYAAPDGEQRELLGHLPYSDVEGQGALLLGKLARFLETLFFHVRELARPHSPSAYAPRLVQLLEDMLAQQGELGGEHHALRAALCELAAEAEQADFQAELTLVSLGRLLERRLERGRVNLGFLAGGVTFCEPVPMRAIPFRVVCLLGMDDESFPRSVARPSFDLMAERPRPGDRNLRDDDRQLFLEALLSARDALHISYVGRSAQDDSARPASVLVDQLLRLCDQHFVCTDVNHSLSLGFEGAISRAIRCEHALQRFDARYFQDTGSAALFSYDEGAARAARSLREPKPAPAPFVPAPLPGAAEPALSLEALQRFLRRPQECFLKERLKIYLPRELDAIADREPIAIDPLERFRIADELLAQRDARSAEERARLLRKAGRLAPGRIGEAQLAELEALVDGVLQACPRERELPEREFVLELRGGRLFGRLGGLEPEARVLRSVGTLHLKRRLSAFVEHLALCATGAMPCVTRLIGREGRTDAEVVEFAPVADARAQLEQLLALYRIGMCMPLPLLHEAAECFVRERAKGADQAAALARARLKLMPARGPSLSAASEDPHVRQVWSLEQLADPSALWASDGSERVGFSDVAERVFGPMLRATRAFGAPSQAREP